MRQAVLAVAGLCLISALAEQLLQGGRFFGAVRMALGLEIACLAAGLAERALRCLG